MGIDAHAASRLPGVTGTVRVGVPLTAALPRLRPGDAVLVDLTSLDRTEAQALVDAGVVAVLNLGRLAAGRYANLGPRLVVDAGVVWVDDLGRDVLRRLRDGVPVRVDAGRLHLVTPAVPGRPLPAAPPLAAGRRIDAAALQRPGPPGRPVGGPRSTPSTTSGASTGSPGATGSTGAAGAPEQPGEDLDELLTALQPRLEGRPVLVVGGEDHADLLRVAAFVREQGPTVVAVGSTALADLVALSWLPQVAVVPEQADVEGLDLVRHVVRVDRIGVDPADLALGLAERGGASVVVVAGVDPGTDTAARLGLRLVDASVLPLLYSGAIGDRRLAVVLLVALVLVLLAVAATPAGQDWATGLAHGVGRLL